MGAFSRDYHGPAVTQHKLIPHDPPVSSKERNNINAGVHRTLTSQRNSVENMERFAALHQPVCAHPGCKKNGIYLTSIKGKWTGKVRYCSLHRNEAMQ